MEIDVRLPRHLREQQRAELLEAELERGARARRGRRDPRDLAHPRRDQERRDLGDGRRHRAPRADRLAAAVPVAGRRGQTARDSSAPALPPTPDARDTAGRLRDLHRLGRHPAARSRTRCAPIYSTRSARGLAAVGTGAAEHATAVAVAQGGREEAALLGLPARVPAALAALANGTSCHALDFDDTHEAGICHSSTVVAPAALAAGEASATRRRRCWTRTCWGARSRCALRSVRRRASTRAASIPRPCAVVRSRGRGGEAFGLDRTQARNALGIVGSFAAGLFEFLRNGSTKPLHAGWAAQAGEAGGAAGGGRGHGTLDRDRRRFGLIASHTDSPAAADEMTETLGDTWRSRRSRSSRSPRAISCTRAPGRQRP